MAATACARQWRQVGTGDGRRWQLFTVREATADAKDEEEAGGARGACVTVVDLRSNARHRLAVKDGEKGESFTARCAKEVSLAEDMFLLLFKGAALRPAELLANVVAAGGLLGMVVKSKIELVWDEANKSKHVQLSDDGKTMSSNHPDYCCANNQVRTTKPFPESGVHEFTVQLSGSEIGCYDSIGLVTKDFNACEDDDYNKRMGCDDMSWSWELGNGRTRHSNTRERVPHLQYGTNGLVLRFILDRDAATLSVETQLGDRAPHERGYVFKDLPAVPLYLCGLVCGHEGRPKMRIVDDASPALDMSDIESYYSEEEE